MIFLFLISSILSSNHQIESNLYSNSLLLNRANFSFDSNTNQLPIFGSIQTRKNIKSFPSNITLYGLNTWAEKYLSIPSNLPQMYTLDLSQYSKVTYSRQGSSALANDGVISPCYSTVSYPSGLRKEGIYGRTFITVTADNQKYVITVDFVDYATLYAEEIIDDYMASISPSLSNREKLEFIVKYPASFDYSASASSYVSMVVTRGGDCWASTSLILYMCGKLGINGWKRNGNRDSLAASGHMNALISMDGKYYECEAGYGGTAPRIYTIKERTSLFSYRGLKNGIEVYQYDVEDINLITSVTVPDSIDGKIVTSIGDEFVSYSKNLTTVKFPDTVTNIGRIAFFSCPKLKTLTITANVETIGRNAFANCHQLTDLTIDNQNQHFVMKGGVIYNVNITECYGGPTVKSVVIPSTVTRIVPYAFYYNANLTSIVIPSSVKNIDEGGLGSTGLVAVYFNGDFPLNNGGYMLASLSKLYVININGNANYTVPDTLFMYTSKGKTIRVPKGAKGYNVAPWTDFNIEYVDFVPLGPSDEPLIVIPEVLPTQSIHSNLTNSEIKLTSVGPADEKTRELIDAANGTAIVVLSLRKINLTSTESQKIEYYLSGLSGASFYIQEEGSNFNTGEFAIATVNQPRIYLPGYKVPLKLFSNKNSASKNDTVYLYARNTATTISIKSFKANSGRVEIFLEHNIQAVHVDEVIVYNEKNVLTLRNTTLSYQTIPIVVNSFTAKGGSRASIPQLVIGNKFLAEFNTTTTITEHISFKKGSSIEIHEGKRTEVSLLDNSHMTTPYFVLDPKNNATIGNIDDLTSISVYGKETDKLVFVICGRCAVFDDEICQKLAQKVPYGQCVRTELDKYEQNCMATYPRFEQSQNKLKPGVIAAIVIACVIAVGAAIAVTVYCLIKRKNHSDFQENETVLEA